jgi:hypothetical protein
MAKEQYENLSNEIIDYFKGIEAGFAMPMDVKFTFVSNSKQKKLVDITKISDTYSYLLDSDILVSFNEDYFENFDDQNRVILIEQEIDKIEFNLEKGVIKIRQPEINTSSGIIEKFTLKLVENANRLQKEYEKQKKDKKDQEKSQKTPVNKKGYVKKR